MKFDVGMLECESYLLVFDLSGDVSLGCYELLLFCVLRNRKTRPTVLRLLRKS